MTQIDIAITIDIKQPKPCPAREKFIGPNMDVRQQGTQVGKASIAVLPGSLDVDIPELSKTGQDLV